MIGVYILYTMMGANAFASAFDLLPCSRARCEVENADEAILAWAPAPGIGATLPVCLPPREKHPQAKLPDGLPGKQELVQVSSWRSWKGATRQDARGRGER